MSGSPRGWYVSSPRRLPELDLAPCVACGYRAALTPCGHCQYCYRQLVQRRELGEPGSEDPGWDAYWEAVERERAAREGEPGDA